MNRLGSEPSPYLRQHAENPVDWYPWGDEAFDRARATDRPVLLSVGYSSCHWCHVMAHESFEDHDTAALMNERFVNVKVDREERPDVDAVYMGAVQALTGRGGWPMTVFLTPDRRPFYGGTYFPPEDRPGLPGFPRVLAAVDDIWRNRRAEVEEQADRLRDAVATAFAGAATPPVDGLLGTDADATGRTTAGALPPDVLRRAYDGIARGYDPRYGGFGDAPKFPPAMALDFLLRTHARDGSTDSLAMVTTTLDHMAAGGIHDHVGGGFARYSTDAFWLVPHFEKMLYDQALLAGVYLRAHLVTGVDRYRRVACDVIDWVLRDLSHPDGGFFSAFDADSEGVEGRYYLWSPAEIDEVCSDDAEAVTSFFGVTASGNFRDPHTGYRGSILHAVDPSADTPPEVERGLRALARRRTTRVPPGRDDKVLLGWNALFLRTLAEAAAALERPDWMENARRGARFLLGEMRTPDGRLLRSWQDGRARHPAYAEDYAALAGALTTLAEVDDPAWLTDAVTVADGLLTLFSDPDGGFFTTGTDAEALMVRPRDVFDDATPSASSLGADALLRLAALTGDRRFEEPARRTLARLAPAMAARPAGFAFALGAYERAVTAPLEIALVGRSPALEREVFGRLIPAAVFARASEVTPGPAALTPVLAGRTLVDGLPAAYVCENYTCRLPVTDPVALRGAIDAVLAARPPIRGGGDA